MRGLFVANRGEIACRIVRTARAMGLRTAVPCGPDDGTAPWVALADVAVDVGPGLAPFLDPSAMVAAALAAGADAVHPGYGFLSERADAARAVLDAGLTWVGPHPRAIAAMGDKLAAKAAAADAGIPLLPSVELTGDDPAAWRPAVEGAGIGAPLLVKAAAGGGGRGMRRVDDLDDLADAVVAARREAEAAFGDGTVFAEQLVPRARHVEVQVVGDAHGHVVHLGERECSIQRRHQKVVEEAPSPAVDDDRRRAMGAAAVRLAEALSYDSLGTVEYVLDADTGDWWFLEVNTRLQVEHPVTEAVTGLDLVRLQLEVADGAPLPLHQDDVRLDGHAIEVRLVAEDPAQGWLPSTGTIHRWRPDPDDGVRWDAGVADGAVVSAEFDSLLAKGIAHAPTRAEAAARLAGALRRLRCQGVATDRDLLVRTLEHDRFLAGDLTTGFLAEHPDVALPGAEHRRRRPSPDEGRHLPGPTTDDDVLVEVHPLAGALWLAATERGTGPWPRVLPGWRVAPAAPPGAAGGPAPTDADRADLDDDELAALLSHHHAAIELAVEVGGATELVRVAIDRAQHPSGALPWALAATTSAPGRGRAGHVHLLALDGEAVRVRHDGLVLDAEAHRVGDRLWVSSPFGETELRLLPRLADPGAAAGGGGTTAPVPGRILAVEVTDGQRVAAGDVLVVLEAMKVEHRIVAPADAVVAEVLVAPGDRVDAHQVLVRLDAG